MWVKTIHGRHPGWCKTDWGALKVWRQLDTLRGHLMLCWI